MLSIILIITLILAISYDAILYLMSLFALTEYNNITEQLNYTCTVCTTKETP